VAENTTIILASIVAAIVFCGAWFLPAQKRYPLTALWIVVGLLVGFSVPVVRDNSTGLILMLRQIVYFHVPSAIAMLVAFSLAAYHGVMWLRRRDAVSDARSLAYAEVGFALCIIATVTGMIFAKANWGAYWSWDPQQIGILTTLLTYAALFALRGAVDDDAKRRDLWAVYAIIGVMTAIFATAVFRRVLPPNTSLHPENTLVTSDPLNKFALWFNVAGYILLTAQIADVRARLEVAREKCKEIVWSRA
jgi:heme exporter protein C